MQERLSQRQQDKLIGMFVAGFGKQTILKRMQAEEGVILSDARYKYWKNKAKEESAKASEARRAAIYEKGFAEQAVRLETLMAQAERLLSYDTDYDVRDFIKVSKELRELLKQIATELHQWQTGDTYNILINVINPVLEDLAFVLLRHVPEGLAREAALEDLGRMREKYIKALPEGQTIKAEAREKSG